MYVCMYCTNTTMYRTFGSSKCFSILKFCFECWFLNTNIYIVKIANVFLIFPKLLINYCEFFFEEIEEKSCQLFLSVQKWTYFFKTKKWKFLWNWFHEKFIMTTTDLILFMILFYSFDILCPSFRPWIFSNLVYPF